MHYLCIFLPLLAALVQSRPQTKLSTDQEPWKPIELNTQPLRYSQFREFVPIKQYLNPTTVKTNKKNKVQVKYKIANATSLKQEAEKINKANIIKNKYWPDTSVQNLDDLANYNNYFTTVSPKKPITTHVFTKVSENLVKNKNSSWFEIKIKPVHTTDKNYYSIPSSVPVDVIENSNPYPIKIPGSTGTEIQLIPDPNNHASTAGTINLIPVPTIGNTIEVTPSSNIGNNIFLTPNPNIDNNIQLTPDTNIVNTILSKPSTNNIDNFVNYTSESSNFNVANNVNQNANNINIGNKVVLRPSNNYSSICPTVTVTSNTFYNNKELCPDLDIVINNQIQNNNNLFTEAPPDNYAVDYEANSDPIQESVEYEEESVEGIAGPSDLEESVVLADSVVESTGGVQQSVQSSSGSSGTSSGGNNRPQLPNLPQLPQTTQNDDEGSFDSASDILGLFNPFNYPLITLVLAPLALIITGTLGLSTFFIPWTIFPTLFLSRKAKEHPAITKDGWFWSSKYKTWTTIHLNRDEIISDRAFKVNKLGTFVLRLIEEFGKKYNSNIRKSWKRRKK